jgi:hypothetical protein
MGAADVGVTISLRGGEQGDHDTDLCTSGGFSALADWVETLDKGKYLALHTFMDKGAYFPSSQLSDQLEFALVDDRPKDRTVYRTANRLGDRLGVGDPKETVSIEY